MTDYNWLFLPGISDLTLTEGNMDSTQKIIILNKCAETLSQALVDMKSCFPENTDVDYYIWKIKKLTLPLHIALYDALQKQITKEDYKNIIEQIRGDGNDG